MNFNFAACQRADNFWANGESKKRKTEKKYKKGEKEVVIYEESVPLGIARKNAWMEYDFNGQKMKTERVRQITYEEESGLFLFEDYILMDDDFDFVSSLFYYVDFNGNIVSKAFSNVVEESYDMLEYEGFIYDNLYPIISSWQYDLLIKFMTQDIRKKYDEKKKTCEKMLKKTISSNNKK